MRQAEMPATTTAAQSSRIASVDVLRGFNMFWIIGGDAAVLALAGMLRGNGAVLDAIGAFLQTQMTHVAWEGFRFYDFIFPLFIFVTGVAIAIALPRQVAREGKRAAQGRVLRRTLLLFLLGILYYGGVGESWADVRVLGVLQRIALCYGIASILLLNLNERGLVAVWVTLLVGYWALMTFVPVPGIGAGSFARNANLADWIDAHYLPGRLWEGTRDPEGLLSTIPAVATCLLGVLAGLFMTSGKVAPPRISLALIAAGAIMAGAGYVWGLQFPVIKPIWTSSFALVAGGYSLMLLGAIHYVTDVRGVTRWTAPFVWIGANAITLYLLHNVVHFDRLAARFVGGDVARLLDRLVGDGAGSFAIHALGLAFAIALAGYLYRRRIFLRV